MMHNSLSIIIITNLWKLNHNPQVTSGFDLSSLLSGNNNKNQYKFQELIHINTNTIFKSKTFSV